MAEPLPGGSNPIGNASLGLGIASASLVFGIGLCAVVGAQQGWLDLAGTGLFVCGASSAFLGLLAFGLGAAGLLNRRRARAGALVGAALGLLGMCMFFAVLRNLG